MGALGFMMGSIAVLFSTLVATSSRYKKVTAPVVA